LVEAVQAKTLAGTPHGFMTRRGGVSRGIVSGLQVGHGADDDPQAVGENRRLAAEAILPGAPLATVFQIHSPHVVVATEAWPNEARPKADALVTDRPGLLLGVVTADCAPVLFVDREAGVVGAAHAGWRGAHGGVLENTVDAMERIGARRARVAAAIGPAIAQPSYEVDAPFRDRFTPEDGRFFSPGRPGHWQFDLEGYAAARLERAGVGVIERLGLDTYSDEARFFSHRRSVHRGEPNYGRQISLIGLPIHGPP
jgi:YfiH family protein